MTPRSPRLVKERKELSNAMLSDRVVRNHTVNNHPLDIADVTWDESSVSHRWQKLLLKPGFFDFCDMNRAFDVTSVF